MKIPKTNWKSVYFNTCKLNNITQNVELQKVEINKLHIETKIKKNHQIHVNQGVKIIRINKKKL